MSRTPQVLAALVAAFALAFLATAGVPAAAATTSQAKAKPAASKATAGKRAKASADSPSPRAANRRSARSVGMTISAGSWARSGWDGVRAMPKLSATPGTSSAASADKASVKLDIETPFLGERAEGKVF